MQLVINLLKILCTNSAWQRRKLGKIIQDWRVIYLQVCSTTVFANLLFLFFIFVISGFILLKVIQIFWGIGEFMFL